MTKDKQSLSQEAVRDEVLEEAAKVCDKHADDWLPHHIPEKGTSKNPIYWQQRHEAAERCAELIRALKREPNAAAESYESAHPKALDEPAPAAPDVESMVKTITEWKGSTLPIGIAREAAALLAKLGQDTSVLMDAVRRYGATMTNDEILAQIPHARSNRDEVIALLGSL